MTAYAGPRKPLSQLRRSDKTLITLFSSAIAVAMLVGVANYYQRTHLTIQGTQEWYRGNEDNPAPDELRFPKTTLELLDVTHPHLFFQSIMFFVLCHVFSLTQVRERWKVSLYAAAFASVLTEAGLPWLIRYGSGVFAPLLLVSTSVMCLCILVLLVWPMREMWFAASLPARPPRRTRRPPIRPAA
jgi:hypothetical protein